MFQENLQTIDKEYLKEQIKTLYSEATTPALTYEQVYEGGAADGSEEDPESIKVGRAVSFLGLFDFVSKDIVDHIGSTEQDNEDPAKFVPNNEEKGQLIEIIAKIKNETIPYLEGKKEHMSASDQYMMQTVKDRLLELELVVAGS